MGIFDSIKLFRPKSNKFDLSHERKMTMNMGDLVPIMVQEVVPGDSFRVNSEVMMRFAPMLAPVMHRVNVFTHYFFVPNRLVWEQWEDFITGGKDGTTMPVAPYMRITNDNKALFGVGKLPDYFGIPEIDPAQTVTVDGEINISALPFRAYQLIYNNYYIDQNVGNAIDISMSSGLVNAIYTDSLCTMRKRSWEKDYFTSALPWAQRGPDVKMPIEGTGTVTYDTTIGTLVKRLDGSDPAAGDINTVGGIGSVLRDSANQTLQVQNIDEVQIDNAETTINDLRRAIKLQEWYEKNARGGARYIEQILSHFGVKSSDARLQRPEYLGGGKTPVVISEVVSTFQQEAEGLPQGNMSGHGVSVGKSNGFARRFEEHGYIIGIISVLPRTAYQQGIPRHLSRFDKFDYYWPEFANIGEQEIKQKEIWWNPSEPDPDRQDEVFAYQSRYAEYKYMCSSVHGDFRTNLAYWHMGRIFASRPLFNQTFMDADPTQRIFAVEDPDVHKLYVQLYNKVDALRPMPYFGTPSF